MNPRLAAIEAKRALLIERAASQRAEFGAALQGLSQPLGFVDRCIGVLRYALARPPLVAGAALILVLLRPRRALKWAGRAWGFWKSYRWLISKTAA